jgi:hypothetical protein
MPTTIFQFSTSMVSLHRGLTTTDFCTCMSRTSQFESQSPTTKQSSEIFMRSKMSTESAKMRSKGYHRSNRSSRPVFKEIENGYHRFHPDDWYGITYFIALQWLRGPTCRDFVNGPYEKSMTRPVKSLWNRITQEKVLLALSGPSEN